jgi:hypothetical protein
VVGGDNFRWFRTFSRIVKLTRLGSKRIWSTWAGKCSEVNGGQNDRERNILEIGVDNELHIKILSLQLGSY